MNQSLDGTGLKEVREEVVGDSKIVVRNLFFDLVHPLEVIGYRGPDSVLSLYHDSSKD